MAIYANTGIELELSVNKENGEPIIKIRHHDKSSDLE
jgi:hypothetical protein